MTQYNDLYIRMSLDDNGSIPRMVTGGISPDVIPYGITPVTDPVSFFTDNFNENVSKELVLNQTNYIYVRMINYYTTAQNGKVFLYYALDSQINDPKTWKTQVIKTSSGKTSVAVTAEASDDIAVTSEAFVWTPAAPPEGENWNLIAQVVTKQNPNPIPTVIPSLSTYVSNNGGIGWETPQLPPPVTQLIWSTTVPYSQGDTARNMDFILDCTNIAVGSQISITSDNATGPNPPISLPNTTVTSSPNFQAGVQSDVPANYSCNLTFKLYNMQGNSQPANSVVKLTVSYLQSSSNNGPSKRVIVLKANTTN